MALQINYTHKNKRFSINNAYARIEHFSGNKTTLAYSVAIYKDAETALLAETDMLVQPIEMVGFQMPIDMQASLTMLYDHLKQQDGFTNGIDV